MTVIEHSAHKLTQQQQYTDVLSVFVSLSGSLSLSLFLSLSRYLYI